MWVKISILPLAFCMWYQQILPQCTAFGLANQRILCLWPDMIVERARQQILIYVQWTRYLITGMITFSHWTRKKMKHRYQSFTRIGRQLQSLERQVYADWTSVSFPLYQRSCLTWRNMTNTISLGPVYEFVCISFRTDNLNCFGVSWPWRSTW